MAVLVMKSGQILVGSNALQSFADEATFGNIKANMVDITTMGSGGYKLFAPGLIETPFMVGGPADVVNNDAALLASILGSQQAVSMFPTGGTAVDDPCYVTRGIVGKYDPFGGKVGDAARWNLDGVADARIAGGHVLEPLIAQTTTGNATVATLAGPLVNHSAVAALHITTLSGSASPTLTVLIRSATTLGFGSPTLRFSFTAATAIGWQFLTLPGAITDGFWRAEWTISGTTPSFTFAVALGIA